MPLIGLSWQWSLYSHCRFWPPEFSQLLVWVKPVKFPGLNRQRPQFLSSCLIKVKRTGRVFSSAATISHSVLPWLYWTQVASESLRWVLWKATGFGPSWWLGSEHTLRQTPQSSKNLAKSSTPLLQWTLPGAAEGISLSSCVWRVGSWSSCKTTSPPRCEGQV